MKQLTQTSLIAFVLLSLTGSTQGAPPISNMQSTESAIAGTWEMVSVKKGYSGEYKPLPQDRQKFKTVIAGRFINVYIENGRVVKTAAGTCEAEGGAENGRYSEVVQHVSSEKSRWYVGPKQVFKSEIKDDRWHIEGVLRGNQGQAYRIAEIWKRATE